MPARRVPYDVVRAAALAEWQRLDAVVGALPDDRFDAPTRCSGWRVAELVAHLAATVAAVPRCLAQPPPSRAETDLLGYLGATGAVATAVADRAREQAAGCAPGRLRSAYADAVAGAAAALATTSVDRLVVARLGAVGLADFLVTRCVEAVVHGLDLAAATGSPADPDPQALRLVVRGLADLLAARAPGRSVEVRVPGPSGVAVQCGEGPRHTRGTPPNLVETDPVTFVELATGRLSWPDAVAAGRVHASGARADLTGILPLAT